MPTTTTIETTRAWFYTVALAVTAASAFACAPPAAGRAPIVRIALTPAFVAVHDEYQTEVVADGSTSADSLDDPTAAQPLLYAWSIDDPSASPTPSATEPQIRFHVAGDRPTAVELTVTDGDGRRTTTRAMLGVSITNP